MQQALAAKLADVAIELAEEAEERRAMFAKDPTCAKCHRPIKDIEDSFIVHRASGESVLIHFVDICFSREVQDMLDRYLAQGSAGPQLGVAS